jgi:non-ribosomal peptide synthase protein (TIGR01720 family)
MKLDHHLLRETVKHLLIHHDGLRSRFVQQGSEWAQFIAAPDDNISFSTLDISALSTQEQIKNIELTCAEAQTTLNLSDGPLFRVILFDLGPGAEKYLFLLFHHLITDGFSTTILMQDFMTAYQQLSQGQAVKLPAKTSSIKYWIERLVEYAQSPAIQQELAHWQTQPGETLPKIPPTDVPDPCFIFESTFQVSGMLDTVETRVLLHNVLKTYNMQLIEVMLATMAEAIGQTKGDRSLYVDILRHGRDIPLDNMDLSRTIGWLVIHYPLLLKLENAGSLEEALPQVRDQYRHPLNGGVGYDLLRYMTDDPEIQKTLRPRPMLVFSHESFESVPSNASSNAEALIRPSSHFSGWTADGKINWPYLLELRTIVANNQLHWVWTTGETAYQRSTIEQLSKNFGDILKKLCNA